MVDKISQWFANTPGLKAHLAMLLFVALISGSFSFGGLASPHLNPYALNLVRFILAFVLLVSIGIVFRKDVLIIRRGSWRFLVLGGLSAAYFITMFVALRITSPVSTSAVFTLVPLMSTGFGWLFLRQVAGFRIWIGLLVSACGALWIIFKGDFQALIGFQLGAGELIFLFGCIAYAAYAPLVRKLNRKEDVFAFTLTTLLGCLLVTLLLAAPGLPGIAWTQLPLVVWFAVFYLAVFTTAVTFYLLQYASLVLPASKVLSYGYLIPVFVIVYEGLLGHGWASATVLAGAAVTSAALLVTMVLAD